MKSWSGPQVPRLPGRGRPLRLHDTATKRSGRPHRARSRGCTSAASRLRRHPPRPRRDVPDLRPACSGSGATPATRSGTYRTSPTSTTRCWSGPSATARSGPAGRAGDRAVPDRHDRAAGAAAGPLRRRGRGDPGDRGDRAGAAATGRGVPRRRRRLLLGRRRPRFGSESGWTRPCARCSPSAAATRSGRARRTRWTRCSGGRRDRASRPGTASSARAARAGTSSARRSRSTGSGRVRRAGRRQRPGLPAPRDVRGGRGGGDRQRPFAQAYVHAGMIGFDGEKMSKSRGNLVLVSRLRAAGVDPMAIRLALLSGHYRADREWFASTLTVAENRLARWRGARCRGCRAAGRAGARRSRARLADDLDTPACLSDRPLGRGVAVPRRYVDGGPGARPQPGRRAARGRAATGVHRPAVTTGESVALRPDRRHVRRHPGRSGPRPGGRGGPGSPAAGRGSGAGGRRRDRHRRRGAGRTGPRGDRGRPVPADA